MVCKGQFKDKELINDICFRSLFNKVSIYFVTSRKSQNILTACVPVFFLHSRHNSSDVELIFFITFKPLINR